MSFDEAREEVEECLEECRQDHCYQYDMGDDGKDRCLMLPNPCRLVHRICSGWRCPLGYHRDVENKAP